MIVDETSQVGTRDAAALVEAVTATPGAQLWCVGDAQQAQAVAAGGLVTEVETPRRRRRDPVGDAASRTAANATPPNSAP